MKRILTVLFVLMIAAGSLSGVGAAATSTVIIDDSTTVNSDTDTVWVDAQAVDSLNGNTFNATVVVTGLNEGEAVDNGTVLLNQSVSISADGGSTTVEYDLTDGDVDSYDKVHISLEGDTLDDPDHLSSSSFGVTERLSGGGGSSGSGLSTNTIIVGALVLGGGFLMLRGNDNGY